MRNLSRTEQTPDRKGDPMGLQQQEREHPMEARADKAWRAAAACDHLAHAARDDAERAFYVRMRNAWITVGNQSQFAEGREQDVAAPLPALEGPVAHPAAVPPPSIGAR